MADAEARLADLLAGLSLAADLGFGLPPDSAVRSCVVAMGLARKLAVPEAVVSQAFYTALLHHVGCTAFAHEAAEIFETEFALYQAASRTNLSDPKDLLKVFLPHATGHLRGFKRARTIAFAVARGDAFGARSSTAACEVAREVARRIGLPPEVQQGLYALYEWFNGKGAPRRLKGEAIPLVSRLVQVSSVATIFYARGGEAAAIDALRRRAGNVLDPGLVEAFTRHAGELLSDLEASDPRRALLDREPLPVRLVGAAELAEVALAFADVADLKSPWFHEQSRRTAELARATGEALGLAQGELADLHLAALLHDVGRVSISNQVWEKPRPLNSADWEQVRLHPYQSERVLTASERLARLGRIAGLHHERLDGSGYHRGFAGGAIPLGARILAAADMYVALTQGRPHRAAFSPGAAVDELRAAASRGQLDAGVVEEVATASGQPSRKRRAWPAGLTEREVEVLRHVARGLSNRAIGRAMGISARTAEHHVQHAYGKIGVSSRAAAAMFALEHGLLEAASASGRIG